VTTPNGGHRNGPGDGASGEEPRVVVRDRRRIDPDTGQVRIPPADLESAAEAEPAGRHAAVPEPTADSAAAEKLQAQLDVRTGDLQRLTAEYANYRKRVDRDRESVLVSAKASLAGELLSVLDDIERAAAHGDLTGAFKAVADKLVATLQKAGLAPFGQNGEPFDPSVHEAVQHDTSPDVAGPTVTAVFRRGYQLGDRILRAALVAVTDHEPGATEPEPVVEATPEEEHVDSVDSDGATAH
jgi:molecular chaperone GrpE